MRPRSILVSRAPLASFAVLGAIVAMVAMVAMVAISACSSFSSDADPVADAGPDALVFIDAGDAATSADGSGAEAGSAATVLASGYAKLTAVAATETSVYFSDGMGGGIFEVSLENGGAVITRYPVGTSAPTSLAVTSDGTIYFAEYGQKRLGSIPPVGSTSTILAGGGVAPVAIALGTSTLSSGGSPVRLVVGALVDANPTSVVQHYDGDLELQSSTPDAKNVFDVAVHAGSAYWTDAAAGTLFRSLLDGAGAMPFAAGEQDCQSVAVDAVGVYWTRPMNKLVRMQLTTSAGPKSLATNEQDPRSVTADASGVYWMTADGKVRRSARNETPAQTIYQGFNGTFTNPYSRTLALTSKYVVWITGDGKVLRLAKP